MKITSEEDGFHISSGEGSDRIEKIASYQQKESLMRQMRQFFDRGWVGDMSIEKTHFKILVEFLDNKDMQQLYS